MEGNIIYFSCKTNNLYVINENKLGKSFKYNFIFNNINFGYKRLNKIYNLVIYFCFCRSQKFKKLFLQKLKLPKNQNFLFFYKNKRNQNIFKLSLMFTENKICLKALFHKNITYF